MALAVAAWVMVVEEGHPEIDAIAAQQSLATLDDLLAGD